MSGRNRLAGSGCLLALAMVLVTGCGSTDPGPGGAAGSPGTGGTTGAGGATGAPTGGPYQPLAVNAMWAYQVNDRGVAYEETNVVEALEDMGGTKAGTMAYRMRESLPNETQLTWYQTAANMTLRHHEQALDAAGAMKSESWFSPYRLRLDENAAHVTDGATWTTTFTENHTSRSKPPSQTSKTETWLVLAANETIVVPAGTFTTLRVSRTDQTDGSIKTYWFARGVGKVKEVTETGHTEELSRYSIPAAQ